MQNPQFPATHHVALAATTHLTTTMIAALVTVNEPEQLSAALSQQEKPVVIENADLSRKFSRLAYWQEARWWLIAWLVYKLLASAIANQYHLEGEWHLKWTIGTSLDGKITLTPTKKAE